MSGRPCTVETTFSGVTMLESRPARRRIQELKSVAMLIAEAQLRGETLERNAIRAKINREIKRSANKYSVDGPMLIAFLDLRTKRFNARDGGLGK